jgi:low temperature requirement protein LtrA
LRHVAERHGLIPIIAPGEALVAIRPGGDGSGLGAGGPVAAAWLALHPGADLVA